MQTQRPLSSQIGKNSPSVQTVRINPVLAFIRRLRCDISRPHRLQYFNLGLMIDSVCQIFSHISTRGKPVFRCSASDHLDQPVKI